MFQYFSNPTYSTLEIVTGLACDVTCASVFGYLAASALPLLYAIMPTI